MKKEPDIRPWIEKHKERRKPDLHSPPHECNVVPAEMHTQMMNERDKKIAELQKKIEFRDGEIDDYRRALKEPQPAREGWWVPWMLWVPIFLLACWMLFHAPAAPKGTVDATGYHRTQESQDFEDQELLATSRSLENMTNQRDHWLRNCRAAYRVLSCKQGGYGNDLMRAACKALDQ